MAKKKETFPAPTPTPSQERLARAKRWLAKNLPPNDIKTLNAQGMASLGAQRGGRARAEKLSQKERSRIAHTGGRARWGLPPDDPDKQSSVRRRKSKSAA